MNDRESLNEEKSYYHKRLGRNIVQLIVGTILLFTAYLHLQGNTAEKMSISSGLQVLSQKVQLRMHNLFQNDGAIYEDKLSMEKNYAEVINVVQNSSCKEKVDLPLLTQKYADLQNESVSDYTIHQESYRQFIVDFYRQVSEECGTDVHTQMN